jgi:hypothetical protein
VDERKRVAADYLEKMDNYLEDAIDVERESTDTIADLLKANQALFDDIDSAFKREEEEKAEA